MNCEPATCLLRLLRNIFLCPLFLLTVGEVRCHSRCEDCSTVTKCSNRLRGSTIIVFSMMFPFISTFLDKATAYTYDGELTTVNSLYFELSVKMCERRCSGQKYSNEFMVSLKNRVEE